MQHFLLIYDYVPDYMERRVEFRSEHLALAWQAHEQGELVLGGIMAEPIDGALLWFQGDSPAIAENFATSDPYVRHGLVSSWRVRPWITAVGKNASNPTRG